MKLLSSWSGGKDSCYALMQSLKNNGELSVILNVMNENEKISRSHGLTKDILTQQAKQLGVPLVAIPSSWENYEENFIHSLKDIKTNYNVDAVVFGDIDLEPHKEWEEKVCSAAKLEAYLPLWKQNRRTLVFDMIDNGVKAIITSCNIALGKEFLGKEITKDLVLKMENLGVDACGENGEYHTVVVNCPLFLKPIKIPKYSKTIHNNYCFLVWED